MSNSAQYADVFAALGSEPRLDIMRLLFAAYPQGMTVGELQAQLQIPNSTLSHHLEKLRVEALVTVQRDRQFLWYSANVETTEALLAFLYNGCAIRQPASQQEQAYQRLELEVETIPSREKFMFENFLPSVQTFLSNWFGRVALPVGFERFTQKAIQAIFLAQNESRRLQHQYVGTEQLLVGLLSEETGIAAQVLSAAGVRLDAVKPVIERQIGRGHSTPNEVPFTPRAKTTLNIALNQSRELGHSYIGTEHLLLGILVEGQGLGTIVLEQLGFSCTLLEQQVRTALDQAN
ncbi:metalloregulator ArsR/SmtB family transcription factor [Leptolyngbya sp. FACHB-17]|uniref:ArsR/SmtB family transcription factor n=1 Tax=unclassified Leptolyngbya TaxID=2650499 RepID=UPI001681AB0C|nr:metalloregulator ArsR/SmtB family transcription factor [Leptolyngbya sp. FACHB-17]MBD2082606.1 metalloregulator ArsR/SmtB family transcription factor [Leptolyngbya sp. FACHB-17]